MKNHKRNTYLSAIALSAALAGCSSQAADQAETTAAPPAQKLPVDVKVVQASPLQQEEVVAGSIVPNREVTITSELSRKVTSVSFDEGSYVQKGEALYQLDNAELLARLRQVQADLYLAQLNEQRLSALLKTETVKQEEYDVAYARLQSLLATQELIKIDLDKTTIRAPFAGKIGLTKVHAGAFVSPGMALVNLQEQGTVKIQFAVSEKYTDVLGKGRKVTFSTIHSKEKLSATITATEAGIDMNTRNLTVYATASNAGGFLKPGMSVRVYFPTTAENAIGFLVPTQALMPSGSGYSVFTVKDGVAKSTPVKIGNRTEAEALITKGLAQGDTVMISNILRTGEGTPVQAVSAN
jgi:membrane fusion protein (multidrug efflux system)